ncbi:cyclopropane fatty acyl phospholipid synthase, partial [Candidatus Falkowbacteria bacterium]|nr:cyclopropane fatty acyl phospholipid synthase [Candidatus Falkowbacteria bacterium]
GRVVKDGSLGLGESYMDGWWESEKLDEFFYHLLTADIEKHWRPNWKAAFWILSQTLTNRQKKSGTHKIGEFHYDLGNDLYKAMLDRRLVYTCGYWKDAHNLDEAQEAKLDLVCRKLNLNPGQKILDIGCGWGSFMKFAAERYGVSVVGVTVSQEQVELGKELCAGLPIEFILEDYREVEGKFDYIVSLGMFEHVGQKNYRTYMEVVHDHLNDNGLFLLHTIGSNHSIVTTDPWLGKYIFPNSMIPSIKQIGTSIENLFIMEDWHNFGPDYDKTLMAWYENFDNHWEELKKIYDERFYRMWKYFLLSSAAGFRARSTQLWQVVLSKKGVPGGYQSIR